MALCGFIVGLGTPPCPDRVEDARLKLYYNY